MKWTNIRSRTVDLSFQDAFNAIFTIAILTAGWVLRILWDSIKEAKNNINYINTEIMSDIRGLETKDDQISQTVNKLAIDIATHYVMKEDLQRHEDTVIAKFDRLESKIDLLVERRSQQRE
jgi:chromosome segregation ATPase